MFMFAYFGIFQCLTGFFYALLCLLVVLVISSSNLARDYQDASWDGGGGRGGVTQ